MNGSRPFCLQYIKTPRVKRHYILYNVISYIDTCMIKRILSPKHQDTEPKDIKYIMSYHIYK